MTEKLPYSQHKCLSHGEIAAICNRCYELALGQQGRQRKQEQEREHEKYLSRQLRKAA